MPTLLDIRNIYKNEYQEHIPTSNSKKYEGSNTCYTPLLNDTLTTRTVYLKL